jgi:hypothetical protein
VNHGAKIFSGAREYDMRELLILCLTPGIPLEWVVNAGRLGSVRRSELKRLIQSATPDEIDAGIENAASITEDDAFAMLKIIPDNYRGAIPLPAQLWLQASPLVDRKVAKLLGVKPNRIWRWRNTIHFDPLTGVRL